MPNDSILDQIGAWEAQSTAELVVDLPIPTWGTAGHPPAWLRVKPVDHAFMDRQRKRIEKAKGPGVAYVEIDANAAIIAAAVVEFVVGEPGDSQAIFALDNPQLLATLKLPEDAGNAGVVRKLLKTDGAVFSMSSAVVRHSGYAEEIAAETVSGN